MCHVLRVPRSGYYAWLGRPLSKKAQQDAFLGSKISEIFSEGRELYGARKIKGGLVQLGIVVSLRRVSRLMKLQGLERKVKRKFKVTTDSKHSLSISPNLLNREFQVFAPNSVWAGDITYVKTNSGWLYLATVMDLYSRKIVGWCMDTRLHAELVNKAIRMAISNRRPPRGLIWHTDRGSQYASKSHRNILGSHGIKQSMSRKGDCWDNAVSESFFATLKNELVYCTNFTDQKQAKDAIFEYIEIFYNRIRLHSTLGYLAPHEFEAIESFKKSQTA